MNSWRLDSFPRPDSREKGHPLGRALGRIVFPLGVLNKGWRVKGVCGHSLRRVNRGCAFPWVCPRLGTLPSSIAFESS